MTNPKAFYVIISILLGLFAADMTMKIINSRLDIELPTEQDPVARDMSDPAEEKPLSAYSGIVERNLFQESPGSEPQENGSANSGDHPVTDLKLVLKGIMIGSRGSSFSLIEDSALRKQSLYRVDDKINNEATLTAIFNDRVVLMRNGRKEILLLDFENFDSTSAPRLPAAVPRNGPPSYPGEPAQSRTDIADLQTRASIAALMRDLRVLPHFSSGQQDGFTVLYVRPDSPLAQVGLERKDVITRINGVPAGELRNPLDIVRRNADATTFDLEVQRGHEVLTMSYTLQ